MTPDHAISPETPGPATPGPDTSGPEAARPATIVTGGGRGIGAAISQRLATGGHDLFLTWRERREDAEAVAERCRAAGARVVLHRIDLADLDAAAAVVPAAVAAFGRVTGLVNNAGITGRIGPFLDAAIEESELVFRINVLSTIVLCRAAVSHMSTQLGGAGGSIVNISSGAATTGSPDTYIPYAASKAAVNVLTMGLAKEFGAAGVRVNTVSPGTTHTEIHAAAGRPDAPRERAGRFPMRRAAEPHEIAGAVAYLLSDDASYTSGADIRITGGA